VTRTLEVDELDRLAEPEDQPRPAARWNARNVGILLAPAMIYLAIRELGLLMLTWMNNAHGLHMGTVLSSWDGRWFLGIAQGGYDGVPVDLYDAHYQRHGTTPLAFFPGYPTAVRWMFEAGGWLGISLLTAALTVTIVAGVFCAYGLARLGRLVRGGSRRTGLVLVALFAASPMAVVLSMAYSEALFCAFVIWSLVGVLERRWVLAGTCCAFAGLVRPTAAALVLAVGLGVLVTVINNRRDWQAWLGGLLAPAGLVGYLAWVAVRTGRWDGWFYVQQQGWDSGFDGGLALARFIRDTLINPVYPFEVGTVLFVFLSLAVVAICVARRLEWPLLVYGIGALAMDLASDGLMNSKVRLMVPAFTLLVPLAVSLARRRPVTVVVVLCAVAVASAWYGAYGLTTWNFAI
jgi:Mannosyltransferase (PIG-V)